MPINALRVFLWYLLFCPARMDKLLQQNGASEGLCRATRISNREFQ